MKWTNKRYNLPKLTQGLVDNLNKPVIIQEIESIINNFPKRKKEKTALGQDGFTAESYQTFKVEMIPILYDAYKKMEAE